MRNIILKIEAMMKEPNIKLDEYIPSTKTSTPPPPTIGDEEEDVKYEYVCVNKEHLIARAMAGYWQVKAGYGIDDEEVMRLMDERYK